MKKSMTLEGLKTDIVKEVQGVWFPYPNTPVKLRIARVGNIEYDKALRKLIRKSKLDIKNEAEIIENVLDIQKPVVAKFILMDWENVVDDKEVNIPYTPEKGLAMFKNPEYYSFYKFVLECAGTAEEYVLEMLEKEKGN